MNKKDKEKKDIDKDKISLFFLMLKNVFKGNYPTPWTMFFWIILFLVYLISPIDIVPDFVFPVIGVADDAALFAFTITRINKELNKFKSFITPQLPAVGEDDGADNN
ncbi:uncharacterized membrane protein YkvA (DUF1232 family) [Elusimicrobium posterum]|uniref:YkvA family protein n=1 Tax=Elusimicrobium posterum TaxID=3116653 RepID=UPI003C78D889